MPIVPNLNFTKRQWMTLAIIGLADFCNAICVSLQAPFFPQEAELKGCTATEYGLVFGVFELVVFIISPLYGQFINRIGPKVLFNGGIFTTGTSAIIFGLLDKIPGHTLFITSAFIIRIIEALGNAAFLTASFSLIAKEFPNNVGTTFASLETFFGLGLIVGPMVGGALYSLGGYFLPFVVLGSSLFATALITLCVLPKHPKEADNPERRSSITSVLQIPGVLICALGICATSTSIGFLSATLEPHLRQFELSPILLGLIFVINGGVYALTAPFWGWLCDKIINPKFATLIGSILIAISFCTVGPASFIPLETKLSNIIIGLVLHGIGISAVLVSTFTDALRTSIKKGLPDNIETYGLISGLWTSTFALGAFIGPSVSGALYDSIGFHNACIFIICLHTLVAFIVAVFYMCCDRGPRPYKMLQPNESILRNKLNGHHQNGDAFNFVSNHKSGNLPSVNSSLMLSDQTIQSCGMHNFVVCNSYSNMHSHQWSSLPSRDDVEATEGDTPLSTSPPRYYGSVDVMRNHNVSTCQEAVA